MKKAPVCRVRLKEVEWWIAKIASDEDAPMNNGSRICFWEKFKSRREAENHINRDNEDGDSPFFLVRTTNEVFTRKPNKLR